MKMVVDGKVIKWDTCELHLLVFYLNLLLLFKLCALLREQMSGDEWKKKRFRETPALLNFF